MRTLGFGPKVLAFVAAACGLVLSLGMPWYGPAPTGQGAADDDLAGKGQEFFEGIGRWFSDPVGTDGYTSLQVVDLIFPVVAGLAVVVAILLFVPATEHLARSAAQLLGLVALGAAVVPLFDQPGNNALVEPRHGWVLAFGCAVVMVMSAGHIASSAARRKQAPTMTSLHDPSLRGGSVAPPR
jgi:hypothetical protein